MKTPNPSLQAEPTLTVLDIATSFDFLGSRARVLTGGCRAQHQLGVVEMDVPPDHMPPLHRHHDDDEGFYVLDGDVTIYLPGEQWTLEAGDFFLAPAGVPHTYLSGELGARWLAITASARFERFVLDVAAGADLDGAEVARLAAHHGIEILGPPGARP